MAGLTEGMMDGIISAINTRKTTPLAWPTKSRWDPGTGFINNDFTLVKSWFPVQELKDYPDDGQVWVVGLAKEHLGTQGRGNTTKTEASVQVSYIKKVADFRDTTEVGPLVELVEQLMECCRLEAVAADVQFSGWSRNEPLKDENETPFSYSAARESSAFMGIFTAFYTFVQG